MPSIEVHTQVNTSKREQHRQFFSGEYDTFATVLFLVLFDTFGDFDFMTWEPAVLVEEVKGIFGVEMPIEVKDKLFAYIGALGTDSFYRDPVFFNHVCNALSGGPTPLGIFEPATVEEAAWAVTEILMSDMDDDEEPEFDPEVAAFVGTILWDADIKPFPPLEFAPDMGQESGFEMPTDPMMVGMAVQERQSAKRDVLESVAQGVAKLHADLDRAQLRVDHRSGRPRQDQ